MKVAKTKALLEMPDRGEQSEMGWLGLGLHVLLLFSIQVSLSARFSNVANILLIVFHPSELQHT